MRTALIAFISISTLTAGCATSGDHCCEREKGPKTLLKWIAHENKTDEKKNGDKKPNGEEKKPANGDEKAKQENGAAQEKTESSGKNGEALNGNGNGYIADESEGEDTITTDRPDFTESSSTVGRGRIQLESGYTFFLDRANGVTSTLHSYPEMLWRIGMFAEWFELRIGQNFGHSRSAALEEAAVSFGGAVDLYLGIKLALTEQDKCLPETALIIQTFIPTGADEFTADRVAPGFNYLFGWDIIEDCLSAGGSFQINQAGDFLIVAQSFTVGYRLTKRIGAYTEWFALFPTGSVDPDVGPEQYFDGGFTYLVTNNFQLDIRAGVGLNEHAANFFTGAGFAVRY